ncbi:hypothetical protein CSOJ01_12793 [Colletotrichum sojae]|uniref:Uncharacterized protein n=1 Tax=Colletotrichum sojae TaxID=2175907 RepID=A0A8H6ML50_9PEZI|nr:hypothetical protein CSOJ01_12793 [Colletotrichum sojae]
MAHRYDEATAVACQHEKDGRLLRFPEISYLRGKWQEPATSAHHRHLQPHVDDSQSWGTMSISDSKSHFTTFSGPHRKTTIHSTTTPSTSRPPSPTRASQSPQEDMEQYLVGIGSQAKSSALGVFGDSIPIRPRFSQLPESDIPQQEIGTPMEGDDERHSGTSIWTPQVCDSREASDSDSDGQGFDLDLEKSANIALATCFGVSLSRLARPFRVIEAFSGFKDRCSDILKDEECFATIDWDDDGFSCFDVEESPEGYHEGGYDQASNRPQQAQSRAGKRPAEDDGNYNGPDKPGTNPQRDPVTKTRGPYKKRRFSHDYSCPFRKRNPKRFNARDHHACANVSYENMKTLK